jgi:hypothetical protein
VRAELIGGAGPGREIIAPGLRLREGATVVARVLQAAAGDGQGLLSLAGLRVRAQLPAQLVAGERLQLVVVGMLDEKVVLRLLRPEAKESIVRRIPASLVAELAVRGDGELLRVANALTGGVIALPGGLVAAIDPGEDGEGAEETAAERGQVLRVVLHSPSLGAIELRVALVGRRIGVGVATEPGEAFALASSGQAALQNRLELVTGLPSAVAVAVRRDPAPERPDPPSLGEVHLYA